MAAIAQSNPAQNGGYQSGSLDDSPRSCVTSNTACANQPAAITPRAVRLGSRDASPLHPTVTITASHSAPALSGEERPTRASG